MHAFLDVPARLGCSASEIISYGLHYETDCVVGATFAKFFSLRYSQRAIADSVSLGDSNFTKFF
jgi:hypothetical protein